MRLKLKICFLLPLAFSCISCSPSDKISFQEGGFTFDTYYNDSYFLKDNEEMHQEIALASHAMALATFNGNDDYTLRNTFLKELWQKENFTKLYFNEAYYVQPTTDSIAYGIASKAVDLEGQKFTLIAVAVRGGYYDGEWASNVTVGFEGNSKGFDEASDQVVKGIKEYLINYRIEDHIKIWISGFSRAAITSNMTAGKLINEIINNENKQKDYYYTTKDIYAYCFEPPMGVYTSIEEARSDKYNCIHNFLNYNDLVPLVCPIEWGFVRYGVDHYYPDRLNDIYFDASEREKIISLYHFSYGAENFSKYTVDDWKFFDVGETRAVINNLPRESIHPSQGRFSRALIHELAESGFRDRETYASYIEEGARDLFATVFGLNEKIDKINGSALMDIIFEYDFIKSILLELDGAQSSQFALDMQLLFLQIFGATEDNFDAVKDLYAENFTLFFLLPQTFVVRKDILLQALYRDNAMGIIIGHIPELSYSFLSACDTRIMGDKACQLNDGSYLNLHIDGPEKVSIIEKGLKKEVFSFINGQMSSDCVAAERFADGSIDIYLPKNGKYEYICEASKVSLSNVDPLISNSENATMLPLSGTLGE